MTDYAGDLTLQTNLAVADDAIVAGTLAQSGLALTIGGDLLVAVGHASLLSEWA